MEKKTMKKVIKSIETAVKLSASNPTRTTIDALFAEGSRKVTMEDLRRASEAAAVAYRTSLEGRTPAYTIGELKVACEYWYKIGSRSFLA